MSTDIEDFDVKDAVLEPAPPGLRERLDQAVLDKITEALEANDCLVELGWQPKGGTYRTQESVSVVSETCLLTVRAILDEAASAHIHDNGLLAELAAQLKQEVVKALPEDLRVDVEKPIWDDDRWVFTFRALPQQEVLVEAAITEGLEDEDDLKDLAGWSPRAIVGSAKKLLHDMGIKARVGLTGDMDDPSVRVIIQRGLGQPPFTSAALKQAFLELDGVQGVAHSVCGPEWRFTLHLGSTVQEGLEDDWEPEDKNERIMLMFRNHGFEVTNIEMWGEDKGWGDLGVPQRVITTYITPTYSHPWTASGHSGHELTTFLILARQDLANVLGIDPKEIDWSTRWREQPGCWEITWFIGERPVAEALEDDDFMPPNNEELIRMLKEALFINDSDSEVGTVSFKKNRTFQGYVTGYCRVRLKDDASSKNVQVKLANIHPAGHWEEKDFSLNASELSSFLTQYGFLRGPHQEGLEDEDDLKDVTAGYDVWQVIESAKRVLKELGINNAKVFPVPTHHADDRVRYFTAVAIPRGPYQPPFSKEALVKAFQEVPGVVKVTTGGTGMKQEFSLYTHDMLHLVGEAMADDDMPPDHLRAKTIENVESVLAEIGVTSNLVHRDNENWIKFECAWKPGLSITQALDEVQLAMMELNIERQVYSPVSGVVALWKMSYSPEGDLMVYVRPSVLGEGKIEEASEDEDYAVPEIDKEELVRQLKQHGFAPCSTPGEPLRLCMLKAGPEHQYSCYVRFHYDGQISGTIGGASKFLQSWEVIPFFKRNRVIIEHEEKGDDNRVAIVAVFREREGKTEVLTCQRESEPEAGKWCIPGGHAQVDEEVTDAARREMEEETHLELGELTFVKKMRNESDDADVYVYGALKPDGDKPKAGDDAGKLKWHPINDLPKLAFDNNALIAEIVDKMEIVEIRETTTSTSDNSPLAEGEPNDIVGALDPLGSGPLAETERSTDEQPTSAGECCKGVQHTLSASAAPLKSVSERGPIEASNNSALAESFVAWHASPYSFRRFDTSREGAHFGTRDQAENLNKPGKKAAKPYLLTINNPLRIRDIGVWTIDGIATELRHEDIISEQEADAIYDERNWTDERGYAKIKAMLLAKGFDGFVYANEQEGEGDSYVAFFSRQIKPYQPVREAMDDDGSDMKDVTGYPKVEENIIQELSQAGLKDIQPGNFGGSYRRYSGRWLAGRDPNTVVDHFERALRNLGIDGHSIGLSYDMESGETTVMVRRGVYDRQPPQGGFDDAT